MYIGEKQYIHGLEAKACGFRHLKQTIGTGTEPQKCRLHGGFSVGKGKGEDGGKFYRE